MARIGTRIAAKKGALDDLGLWLVYKKNKSVNQSMDTIRERYEKILNRIDQVARSAGRNPGDIRLVVVTKLQPVEIVREAIAAGARYLGENYADEAMEKKIALHGISPAFTRPGRSSHTEGIQWHIIGHVQGRKAHLVCEHFDYLHSLDSLKLAQRLENSCANIDRILPVLLEFNLSGEPTKSGWPALDETRWEELLPEVTAIVNLPHLRLEGLMTMPPFFDNPEDARPYFIRLRKLQEYFKHHVAGSSWRELSMGMSGDYEVAIQEGATWVRIGQAILGPRGS
jgi:hypothetical protein